jgi:hypothetical protein
MSSVFYLGKLLAVCPVSISIVRSGVVSWEDMAENNVLLIGSRIYAEQQRSLSAPLDITLDESGIHVLHPRPGESAYLQDHYPGPAAVQSFSEPDDGEVHALITHTPGPLGSGDIQSFSSNHGPGTLAAVQWFTNPNLAHILIDKLRKPNGEIPRYYQIVLKVKYKDSVPTEISYLLHRELQVERPPGGERRPGN